LLEAIRAKAAKNKPAAVTPLEYAAKRVAEKAAGAPDGDAA
jgi:hypothetical protein